MPVYVEIRQLTEIGREEETIEDKFSDYKGTILARCQRNPSKLKDQ